MTDTAVAIVGALFGALSSATIFLAYGLSRFRERLARVETILERNGWHKIGDTPHEGR